jgi:aminotransferase EvaB
VDVDEETTLMDPGRLADAVGERSRAVMPVHLYGRACSMDAIADFCSAHGLHLVEDCAQALGARHAGRPVGTFGIGCFSLHPLKPLAACGDAGFIATGDEDLAQTLRCLRNLGLVDRDHCALLGVNSRLDTVQAAMLLVKEPLLDAWIEARRDRARRYREALAGRVDLPAADGPGELSTYSAFVIRHPRRDRLQELLAARGVDARPHYPLAIHQQAAFADLPAPSLPCTERVVATILSLPVSPELDLEGQERVIAATLEALDEIEQ